MTDQRRLSVSRPWRLEARSYDGEWHVDSTYTTRERAEKNYRVLVEFYIWRSRDARILNRDTREVIDLD